MSLGGERGGEEVVLNEIHKGELQILYTTPEMYAMRPNFFDEIQKGLRNNFSLA